MNAPIGFIQTLEELGKVVGRYATRIEYLPDTGEPTYKPETVVVDPLFVSRAVEVHRHRRGKLREGFSSVEGHLVELNVVNRTLKLAIVSGKHRRTVHGIYDEALNEPLIRRLGRRIRVSGPAEFRSGSGIRKITVTEYADVEEALDRPS